MFQRDALIRLRTWRDKPNRKPLIIRGARQVGKTTLVDLFAKEFDDFLSLNLERPSDHELFERNDSPENILTAIYLSKNKSRKKGKVLLFIDEIQNSPKAVALLRYFYEDLPGLYVVAAGSLLESLIDNQISFPVGRVEYMALRPCSFSEFLGALGENQLQEAIQTVNLPQAIHGKVMSLFNEYALVGGMPEAVSVYAQTKDMVALRDIYETLLTGYRDDIEKYATNASSRNVLRHILLYGWPYAAQRIRFEKFANSNYKSREMADAMRTLEKALLLELSYPTTSPAIPIQPDLKRSPKLFWLDTGLVNHVAGLQQELFGIKDLSQSWKGKIAEHIVGQELLSASSEVTAKRHFWVREARNSQAEIDFLYQHNTQLISIEVKSGDNSKLKSLQLFMKESGNRIAIRFWSHSFSSDTITLSPGKTYTLFNLPFYYAGHLDSFLDKQDEK